MPHRSASPVPIKVYVEALNAQFSARIAEHQEQITKHKREGALDKDNPRRRVVLLANGDSWFDYPLGGIPLVDHTDIIAQIKSFPGLKQPPVILNLANAGDTTLQSMGLARRLLMEQVIKDERNGPIEGILYSGGGDDIAGDQFLLWLQDTQQVGGELSRALNSRFGMCLDLVMGAYEALVDFRGRSLRDAPIFVHNYDFPTPSGIPACTVPHIGPWMKPGFEHQHWSASADKNCAGALIIKDALVQFDTRLKAFTSANSNIVYVNTHGSIDQETGWANELHPKPPGFLEAAHKFVNALKNYEKFKGRIF